MPAGDLFPPRGGQTINYDWIDIASATGYIVFDGLNAKDSVGNNFILIDSSHATKLAGTDSASVVVKTNVTGNSGLSLDADFDLSEFQLPRTIEGNGFLRLSACAFNANAIADFVFTAKLRKWDGASETPIVSATSTTGPIPGNGERTRTLILVIPKTHFKKGEQLRLTIEVTTSDNDVYTIGHNPQDAAVGNFSAGNSRMTLAIPFKLDFM